MKRFCCFLLSLFFCLAPLSVSGVSESDTEAFSALVRQLSEHRNALMDDLKTGAAENRDHPNKTWDYDSAFPYYMLEESEFLRLDGALPLEGQEHSHFIWCLPELIKDGETQKHSLNFSEVEGHAVCSGSGIASYPDMPAGRFNLDQKLIDAFSACEYDTGKPVSIQFAKVTWYCDIFLILHAQNASFVLYFSLYTQTSSSPFDFWTFYPLTEAQELVREEQIKRDAIKAEAAKPKIYPLPGYSVTAKESASPEERLESVRAILSEQKKELDDRRDEIRVAFESYPNTKITDEQISRARRMTVSEFSFFSDLSPEDRFQDLLSAHPETALAVWQAPCTLMPRFGGWDTEKDGFSTLQQLPSPKTPFVVLEVQGPVEDPEDQPSDQEIIDAVAQSELLQGNVTGIYFLRHPHYRALFVYLTGPDGEFLIPYPEKAAFEEEKLPVERGRLYPVREIISLFADYDAAHRTQEGGAIPASGAISASGAGSEIQSAAADLQTASLSGTETQSRLTPLISALIGLFVGLLIGAVWPIEKKQSE